MSMSRKLKKKLAAAALALSVMSAGTAYAEEGMPQGGSVVTATAPTGFNANPANGAAMTATANTLINWDSFNLGSGKSLTLDPNGFVFMHQVTGATQSEIMGLLNGGTSGHLIIANSNGIFVNGATINASHLTLTTMQNLDATGFGKLTSGGWGPEVDTNGAGVGIVNSTITVNHYLGVLAGNILIDDHVTVNTQNSTIDLTAVKNGQYSLLMGRDAFYSNGVQYTTTSNGVKIGSNTVVLNANGNSYNQIHVLGGQVAIGDYAQLNTGSDPDRSNVLVEAVATKNDSESDPDKVYTASEDNVINMGLVSFSNGSFALKGGKLTGETESVKDNFTQIGGATPPTPPTPPEPGDITDLQKAQAHEDVNNLLDSAMNNDAVKAFQDALSGGSQKGSETGDHVVVQTGAEQNDIPNITKGLEGLTVKEAAARSRNLAKQYVKALQDGDKARADELKQQLKDANNTVKVLKEQEKLTKEEAEKTKEVTSTSQKPTTIEDYEKRFPGISELLNRPDWPQQQSEQPQQQNGEAVVTGGSQESDALKRLNDIIGEKLLTQEADARARLRKAQTSEERQQIMKELDEIHRQETEKVKEAEQQQGVLLNRSRYAVPAYDTVDDTVESSSPEQYGHYQYKVEYKLGDNQDDGSYRVNVPQDQMQQEKYEAILRGLGNGDAQTGASQQGEQQSQIQQDEEKPSAPPLSELIQQFGTEQQKQALQQQQQKQQQQGGGIVITTAGEQKDSGSKINDLIGTELLEKETTARNKLVKAKTSEEKAEAMKELDEVHKEETEKVNKLLKEQEEKQRIETMQQQLETQRKYEDQLKVVGGKEGGEALTRGAKRAGDAVQRTKDLEKHIDDLKKEYDETDKAARKLTDQYYKAKDAGASKEELEKIAKAWNELDQKRSELDKQRDNALVDHMNASDEAAKEAAEYSRLQGIAKEAQQELDKLGLDKAKDDLAAKQAEYDRVSGRDIENGRDSAAEAAMKAVDDKYAAELRSLHQQYDEAINNGTSEDIERASSLLENKNMEVGLEKSEAANKAEEEYMTAERKELLQKLQSDKEAITQAEKNLNEAQQKVSNLEKVESAIREKAQDMLTAPDRINDAESAQIKAGVDAQVAALQHKSTEREYGFSSMQAGVTRSILNTSKDKYEAATANVNDLREKANYQPGQSANVFSATRQQTEAALKAGTGK